MPNIARISTIPSTEVKSAFWARFPPPEKLPHACVEVLPDGVTARWQHFNCLPADSRGWDQISYIQTDDKGSYAVCLLDSTLTGWNSRGEPTYRAKDSFVSQYHKTKHPAGSIYWLKPPATTIPPSTDQQSAIPQNRSRKGGSEVTEHS